MTEDASTDNPEIQGSEKRTGTDDNADGYLNISNVMKLGAGFFFVFSAFISLQNLMPQLLKELGFEGLGFILVAIIYTAFIFAALVAPVVLQYCSELRSVWLSSLGYAFFCASLILPASCSTCSKALSVTLLVSAAIVVGVCAPFLWVPQGAIMTYNTPQRLTNTYQMIFQVCFQAASPVGFAISYVLVGNASMFFAIFTCVSILGTALLATIRQPTHHSSIPVCDKETISLRQTISPMVAFILRDRRARAIGVYGVLNATMFNAVPSCVLPMFASGTSDLAKMLFSLGVGTFVSSMAFGHVADRFGRLACLLAGGVLNALCFGLLALSECGGMTDKCTRSITLVASAMMGLANGTLFANLFACITGAVHDVTHAAFATQQIFISLGSIVAFLVLPSASSSTALIVCASVLVLCVIYLLTCPHFFRTLQLEHAKTDTKDSGRAADADCKAENGEAVDKLSHDDKMCGAVSM